MASAGPVGSPVRPLDRASKVYIAGHQGLAGGAILRRLARAGFANVVARTSQELDLRDQRAVEEFFARERPTIVVLAAAKVGGIAANNDRPAEFIAENLQIQTNVIHSAWRNECKKLLFLGSSCVYPKLAPQPMTEDALLTGPLEPTNQWYAVAKIAGIKMGQAYRRQYGFDVISVMPTNLYGPGDNFHPTTSHVLPALLRRFHEAKEANAPEVVCWGTGSPRREFLHADDLADAVLHLLDRYSGEELVNIGTGTDLTIKELAQTIARIVGYQGAIVWDPRMADGAPRKLQDVSRLTALGWRATIALEDGIASTYEWYVKHPERRG